MHERLSECVRGNPRQLAGRGCYHPISEFNLKSMTCLPAGKDKAWRELLPLFSAEKKREKYEIKID